MEQALSYLDQGFIYELVTFVLSIVVLIMYVRIIVRVEKRLDTFFKLMGLAALMLTVRQLVLIGIRVGIIGQVEWITLIDISYGILVIVALFIMGQILSSMNRQK